MHFNVFSHSTQKKQLAQKLVCFLFKNFYISSNKCSFLRPYILIQLYILNFHEYDLLICSLLVKKESICCRLPLRMLSYKFKGDSYIFTSLFFFNRKSYFKNVFLPLKSCHNQLYL